MGVPLGGGAGAAREQWGAGGVSGAGAPAFGGAHAAAPEYVYAWDDTSQQPVLSDPRVVRELQTQGHVVVNLMDAYRTKLASLQNAVNGPLLGRRDTMVHQLARVQARLDEVAAVKATIERETRANCDEILERLRSAESFKVTLLQRDWQDLSREVDAIQGFLAEATRRGQSDSVLEFLKNHRALEEACHRIVNKPFREVVPVTADDFEHEARAYTDLANRHKALTKLLSVKDQMIWQLLAERDQLRSDMTDLISKYNTELEEMEAQCQKYHNQLFSDNGAPAED